MAWGGTLQGIKSYVVLLIQEVLMRLLRFLILEEPLCFGRIRPNLIGGVCKELSRTVLLEPAIADQRRPKKT
jgi:hypothetical protein